jgi:hypothetical protein
MRPGTFSGRWKRFSVALVQSNHFFDNCAKLIEHCSFVISVAATIDQARSGAYKAMVLFRPGDDLGVTRILIHCPISMMAFLTALT